MLLSSSIPGNQIKPISASSNIINGILGIKLMKVCTNRICLRLCQRSCSIGYYIIVKIPLFPGCFITHLHPLI